MYLITYWKLRLFILLLHFELFTKPFVNKPNYLRDLSIFMISLICSLENVNVVVHEAKSEGAPNPNTFLWIGASVADAAANPNDKKILLANGLGKFPI